MTAGVMGIRGSKAYVTCLTALLAAWVGNVVRIWALAAVCLAWGPSASDPFHQWANPLIAVLIVCISVYFALKTCRTTRHVHGQIMSCVAVAFIFPLCLPLIDAATNSPRDRALPILLILWLATGLAIAFIAHKRSLFKNQQGYDSITDLACIALLISFIGNINAIGYIGICLFFARFLPMGGARWLWIGAGASWWPFMSYVTADLDLFSSDMLRAVLAVLPLVAIPCLPLHLPHIRFSRVSLSSCAIMLLGLLVCWYLIPTKVTQDRISSLKQTGIEWPLKKSEQNFYGNAAVARRLLTVHQQRLALTVIDGSNNRHAVHDPWYCCQSRGWRITDLNYAKEPAIPANQLRLEHEGKTMWLCWWYSDGNEQWTDHGTYLWRSTLRRVTRGYSGPEPYLIICQSLDGHISPDHLQQEFPAISLQ